MPLAILFGIFAALGLLVAIAGHMAMSGGIAPSMNRNNVSPVGYAIFFICGLIALAAYATSVERDYSSHAYPVAAHKR